MMDEEARRKAKRRDYIERGLAEWHRQRNAWYAERAKQQQERRRPFQLDQQQAQRGSVSPLGGVATGKVRR